MASFKRDFDLVNKIETNIANGAYDDNLVEDLLTAYKKNTFAEYKDRHQFYREVVSDMVNDMGFEDENLAEHMANEHPTLQQSFMRFVVKFIKKMAEKTYTDGRNEASVALAKQLAEVVKDSHLPFV